MTFQLSKPALQRSRHFPGVLLSLTLCAQHPALCTAQIAPADETAAAISSSPEFRAAAPPRLQPGSVPVGDGEGECTPGRVYEWTSEQGLRYTWSLPPSYEKGKAYDLIVLCHGTGLDYRWGHANHDPATFRPNDIIISPDGPSEGPEGTRLFLGEPDDALTFRDFLLEMARTFPARGIFLYGHSQGGFFVAYFAGEWPGATEGVVAHASGAWSWSDREGGVLGVPIVFMHGTADPVVPYRQSPAARDAYAEAGHELVALRRLPGYNHWPNPVRTSEAIDYCIAMRTENASEALDLADALLERRPKDTFGYEAPPPFALAAKICRRILASHAREGLPLGIPDFEKPATDDHADRARALLDEMNAHAARHIAALSSHVSSRAAIAIDGSPWLGHMLALREDFRGVEAVEDYVKKIAFDRAREQHREASVPLYEAWYGEGVTDAEKFETVVAALHNCFLLDGLPEVLDDMRALHARAEELQLSETALEQFELVQLHDDSLEAGRLAYEALWRTWRQPEPEPQPVVAAAESTAPADDAAGAQADAAAAEEPTIAPITERIDRSGDTLRRALVWGGIGAVVGVLIGVVYVLLRHRTRRG